MKSISRRHAILGGVGVVASAALSACSTATSRQPSPPSAAATFGAPPTLIPQPGQKVMDANLTARSTTLDLAGRTVDTWAYDGQVPGPLIRATAGDLVRVRLQNALPDDTTIHWHGIALRNAADGVPGVTQDPIQPNTAYTYEFTAPDPGTYFFHPHVGVQLDRGLYAPLIIDDPNEPGDYDAEWVVVLDDWIDGTGTTPDQVLADLKASGSTMGGMDGMHMDNMDMSDTGMGGGSGPWGDAGDVTYPLFLLNGRPPADPDVLTAKPGQRVRLRIINAASDTIFTLALGDHQLKVTHTDGYPVQPAVVDALYIGMGERYDAVVTLADGVFPLVARPYGKTSGGQALGLVRTGPARGPPRTSPPAS